MPVKKMIRYAFSDLVIPEDVTNPTKYISVHDSDGNLLGEVECYFADFEEEEVDEEEE